MNLNRLIRQLLLIMALGLLLSWLPVSGNIEPISAHASNKQNINIL